MRHKYIAGIDEKTNRDSVQDYRTELCTSQSIVFECDLKKDTFISYFDNWATYFGDIPNNYDEAVMQSYRLCHPHDAKAFYRMYKLQYIEQAMKQGQCKRVLVYRILSPKGKYMWMQCKLIAFADDQGKVSRIIAGCNEIDDKKEQEGKILFQARHDTLTGLFTSGVGQEEMNNYLRSAPNGGNDAFVMIDIDNFRQINDTYGHLLGDQVLMNIAHRIQKQFWNNAITMRMGGDEFGIFIQGYEDEQMLLIQLDQLRVSLSNKHQLDDPCPSVFITASIGASLSPEHGRTFRELYFYADHALLQAKEEGKNQVIIFDEHNRHKITHVDTSRFKQDQDYSWQDIRLLDEMEDIVYISDPVTYEMIYMNRAGLMAGPYSTRELKNLKCYEYIHNADRPCSFCTNHLLSEDRFYVWEHVNTLLNRRYLIKDKLVRWNNRLVRMEIAMDITDYDVMRHMLSAKVEVENVLLECINKLVYTDEFGDGLYEMLKAIGGLYHADRAYVFLFNNNQEYVDCKRYEWYEKGKRLYSDLASWQMQLTMYYWRDIFQSGESVWITDIESLKDRRPIEYEYMKRNNVRSSYTVPFKNDGEILGFIGVDNPMLHLSDLSLLHSMAQLIQNEMEKRNMRQKQEYMNRHDLLTGLLNRSSFLLYLEKTDTDKLHSMGVVVVNVNGLKRLNQNFGYAYGDSVLKQTAEILTSIFEEYHVFRFSGDEFVVLGEDIELESCMRKVEQLKLEANHKMYEGYSVGYTWNDSDIDIDMLINHANDLMMVEKQSYYRQRTEDNPDRRSKIQQNLFNSIKSGEFKVYLQPKVEILTGKIMGAESLIRYETRLDKFISPSKFIPILEAEQQIRYIDLFVFEEVCRILARWKQERRVLIPISVNFSRLTLMETDLPHILCSICDQYDVERRWIKIEITETIGELERETLARISDMLTKQGFQILLDDFGSQYSSLSLVSAVDVNGIKIDKSLVQTLAHNQKSYTVVKHILKLCRAMQLKCIAEGVETDDQLEMLKEAGCDYVQGYLFGKPMPVAEFESLYDA